MFKESRKFIRHAVNVPLEISTVASSPDGAQAHEGVNVSYGGLAFLVDQPIEIGKIVSLRMPTVQPPFEAQARVTWCQAEGVRYRVGVEFMDSNDAFQSRMVEQVCAIEEYRINAMKKGRRLTTPEAADEWIRKFANQFP